MTQRTRDPGHERRYFTMVPHLITDKVGEGGLSATAFALYVYYRRQCGEHGENFSESIRTTARRFGKSVGTVFAARQQLVEAGLVFLNLVGALGHEVAEITIRDVWPENMERYGPRKRSGSDDEDLRSTIERKSSRASGSDRTQSLDGVRQQPDASVQLLNAPLTSSGKTFKNPEEEKPEDVAAAPTDDLSVQKNDDDDVVIDSTQALSGDTDPLFAGDVWRGAIDRLRGSQSEHDFEAYLAGTLAVSFDVERLILLVAPSNPFHVPWLLGKLEAPIASAVAEEVGCPVRVEWTRQEKPEERARPAPRLGPRPASLEAAVGD